MKKINLPSIALLAVVVFSNVSANAQCYVSITGNPCILSTLTANFSGAAAPDTVKWYRDGVLQQVKTKRNPQAVVVAGGGTTDPAQLYGPQDVFVDEAGNVYVVDDGRQRVQKWAPGATAGVTVAGGNGKGSALNQFFTPKSVVVDGAGNVYVSDDLMARVTKWAPGATAGVVVAGGNGEGSAANQLFGPQNICMDNAGNIYIADRWNDRVQKWAPGAAYGVTVAGGNGRGSAANQFAEPLDVDVDAAGNIYVVDYFNNRVQKWAPSAVTGITVAGGNGSGTGPGQFNFTTALTVSPEGNMYVRDQNNYRIQKWAPGAAYGVTVAGGNSYGTGLNQVGPGFGLFVDKEENIFVNELFVNTVNKFRPAATADMLYTAAIAGAFTAAVRASNGCTAQSPAFTVEAIPAKPAAINGPKYVNTLQTNILYRVQKHPGHTYNWTVPADAVIIGGQGTFRILVNWGYSSGTVTVTESSICGTSEVKKKNVFISGLAAQAAPAIQSAADVKLQGSGVYPNPAKTGTNLRFYAGGAASYTIQLTDMTGKLMMTSKHAAQQGANNVFINLNTFGAGVYFIRVTDDKNKTQVFKCVKL